MAHKPEVVELPTRPAVDVYIRRLTCRRCGRPVQSEWKGHTEGSDGRSHHFFTITCAPCSLSYDLILSVPHDAELDWMIEGIRKKGDQSQDAQFVLSLLQSQKKSATVRDPTPTPAKKPGERTYFDVYFESVDAIRDREIQNAHAAVNDAATRQGLIEEAECKYNARLRTARTMLEKVADTALPRDESARLQYEFMDTELPAVAEDCLRLGIQRLRSDADEPTPIKKAPVEDRILTDAEKVARGLDLIRWGFLATLMLAFLKAPIIAFGGGFGSRVFALGVVLGMGLSVWGKCMCFVGDAPLICRGVSRRHLLLVSLICTSVGVLVTIIGRYFELSNVPNGTKYFGNVAFLLEILYVRALCADVRRRDLLLPRVNLVLALSVLLIILKAVTEVLPALGGSVVMVLQVAVLTIIAVTYFRLLGSLGPAYIASNTVFVFGRR